MLQLEIRNLVPEEEWKLEHPAIEATIWSSVAYKCILIWPNSDIQIGGAPAYGVFHIPPGASSVTLKSLDDCLTADFYISRFVHR